MREYEILDLASPIEREIEGDCNWWVLTEGVEQPVYEDNLCVVDTVSDCASGEAGFDGIVNEGSEK